MSRVKRGVTARARHKKILKLAKGYHGARSKLFKSANEAVMHALSYAYRDRRTKKRDFHRLWIQRINAAARENGMTYSRLMAGLKVAGVEINRKMLAEMAVNDAQSFTSLVALARDSQASEAAVATA
jgi:large subunit ribosomal protein L20